MVGGVGFRSHVRHFSDGKPRDGPGPEGATATSGASSFQGGMQSIPRPGRYQGGQDQGGARQGYQGSQFNERSQGGGGRQGYQGSQFNNNQFEGGRAVGRHGGGGGYRGKRQDQFQQKDPRPRDRFPRGLEVRAPPFGGCLPNTPVWALILSDAATCAHLSL